MPQTSTLILGLGDEPDSRVLTALLEAAAKGRPFAVLNPEWPEPFRRELADLVRTADVPAGHLVTFTSGTSGRPRGILRTRTSWDHSVAPLTALTGLGTADVVGLPGPLASSLFLYGAWHAAAVGARVVTADQWEDTRREVTAVHTTPGLVPSLLRQRDAGHLPALRCVVTGGAHLADRLRQECASRELRVVEYYGSAETSFVLADGAGTGLVPFPGCEVEVRQQQIWVHSPYVCAGYIGDEHGPLRVAPDGFWSVGDRAVALPGGRFEVLGRDGGITVGGHTVHLADVEHLLNALPGMTEAVVVPVPHTRWGQVPVAVYQGLLSPDDLRAAARELPGPARPRHVLQVDELPRTTAGKPDRAAISHLAEERFA